MPPDQNEDKKELDLDFILNTNDPAPKPKFQIGKTKLIFIILAISGLLLVLFLVFLQIQAKNSLQQRDRLIKIAQSQKEISRISYIGAEGSDNEDSRSRDGSINKKMDESLEKTKGLLAGREGELNDETLSATQDETIEKQLDDAKQFNNFDKVLNQILNSKLTEYQRILLEAAEKGNGEEKPVLESYYDDANSMLGLTDES